MKYIFIDPSGDFTEGKGHTGIASIIDNNWDTLEYRSISAKDFKSRYEYWCAIINIVLKNSTPFEDMTVIIESFMIRSNGFMIGKMPETIRFIGALELCLLHNNIKYTFQTPTQAKSRFKDESLVRYIPNFEYRSNGRYYLNNKQVNDHIRDALKHLLYFIKYRKDK